MFADNWCIKSNERVYGPYSSRDLKKFAHEGRFAAWSLVAPAGSRDWKEARHEPVFAQFFGHAAPTRSRRGFGKLDLPADELTAPSIDAAQQPRRAQPAGNSARSNSLTEQLAPANFVIIFDAVNAAASRVENALSSLGTAFRLAENVWTVNCGLTAIGVRNALSAFLKPNETLFVIDATNGRTSWQNYAPEAHAKITKAFVHSKH